MSGNPLSGRRAVLLLAALGACGAHRSAPTPPRPSAPAVTAAARAETTAPVLARVDVIGASASAGFGIPVVGLADALDALIVGDHEPVRALAEPMFFLAPEPAADRQVRAALERPATLVVAVDFLFWFGYGLVLEEDDRLELLERGLERLDRLACPLVVATVPEMREAIGKMLLEAQVPSPATLDAIEERILAWAAERPRVAVLALPELVTLLRAGEPFVIGGSRWPESADVPLLLPDELHPTVDGLAGLACQVGELVVARGMVPAEALRIDPSAVARELRRRIAAAPR